MQRPRDLHRPLRPVRGPAQRNKPATRLIKDLVEAVARLEAELELEQLGVEGRALTHLRYLHHHIPRLKQRRRKHGVRHEEVEDVVLVVGQLYPPLIGHREAPLRLLLDNLHNLLAREQLERPRDRLAHRGAEPVGRRGGPLLLRRELAVVGVGECLGILDRICRMNAAQVGGMGVAEHP